MTDINLLKSLLKGLLTFIPGFSLIKRMVKKKGVHSGSNAEFCYNLWLRILIHLNDNNIKGNPKKIGELGNGGSFGVGICALLTGSSEYYALEIENNSDVIHNLKLLDEIIILLKNKAPLKAYKAINIEVNYLKYPDNLIVPNFLNDRIVEELKESIVSKFQKKKLLLINNWSDAPSLHLDFIFSRAVFEHVNKPDEVYNSLLRHLKKETIVLHDIEFHSHGITNELDGHFEIPEFLWLIIKGNRKYFQNRWSLNDHVSEILKHNFSIIKISEQFNKTATGRLALNGASILAEKC
jgi:hypothetical protein